jgi:ATP-dependent protease ClpP protease subunit
MDPQLLQRANTARRVTASTRQGSSWFRIENRAATSSATVLIYDEIGYFGLTAQDLVHELAGLDVAQIDLRLNSPGGSVWDGAAIYHALRNHPAKVIATVDGLAASAASFIAMAGDEVVMESAGTLMIHDAFTVLAGNADDLRTEADLLDKLSDTIAGIYAEKSGRPLADFRALMKAETWFNADEAVAAGLADRVAGKASASDDDDEDEPEDKAPANRWDLSIFNYSGRDQAPAPVIPAPVENAAPVADAVPTPTAPVPDLASVIRNAIQEAQR